MQHIKGSSHKNKVFNEVIRRNPTYQRLYHDLPREIREADSDGTVKVDNEGISCTVCKVKLSGEQPMLDHIKSSSHNRKKSLNIGFQAASYPKDD